MIEVVLPELRSFSAHAKREHITLNRLGAKRVVKHGANFVRPVFLTVVTLILLRLIWLNYR